MKRSLFIICILCSVAFSRAQNNPDSVIQAASDTLSEKSYSGINTCDTENNVIFPEFKLRNQDAPIGKKLVRGVLINSAVNATMITALVLSPKEFSMWTDDDRLKWYIIRQRFKNAYTNPPVIDHDLFFTNYVGHPYQGSLYFNTIRSQGSTFLESSLYNLAQSAAWEYVWEAGMEQPSIQDLIVTPIVGTVLGELFHKATLGMRKNGFNWYEKVIVCIINPYYAVNNGLSTRRSR